MENTSRHNFDISSTRSTIVAMVNSLCVIFIGSVRSLDGSSNVSSAITFSFRLSLADWDHDARHRQFPMRELLVVFGKIEKSSLMHPN